LKNGRTTCYKAINFTKTSTARVSRKTCRYFHQN